MMISRKLKKDFKYRGLGGKTIIIEFELTKDEIVTRMAEGNWACYNFMDRRKDFNTFFTQKLYYGKVDGLGYVVAEDELQ